MPTLSKKEIEKKKTKKREKGVADLPITGPRCKKEMDAYITELYILKKKEKKKLSVNPAPLRFTLKAQAD